MAEKERKFTRKYIIDSGAIIKGLHLEKLVFGDSGEIEGELHTIPEVIGEIRDRNARHLLESLPVSLQIREPSDEAIDAVSEFARKTGDFAQLSSVDLRVLALVYMIEKEVHGNLCHLRTEPKRMPVVVSMGGFLATEEQSSSKTMPSKEGDRMEVDAEQRVDSADGEKESKKMKIEDEKEPEEEEWITPTNLKKQAAKEKKSNISKARKMKVACVTTDFAMQNVLVQMGMVLLSVDGTVIKNVRQYALKCDACKKTTLDTTRIFCPTCGNDALARVSISVTKDGTAHIYGGRSGKPRNLRGTQYSLPKPKGGRESGKNPILSEDQLLMGDRTRLRKMGVTMPDQPRSRGKTQQGAFEETEFSFAPKHSTDLTVGKGEAYKRDHVIIGHPKSNPNERRRTTRSRRKKR